MFDPLGHRYKERQLRGAGPRGAGPGGAGSGGAGHLESTHQQMDGFTAAAKRLWENRWVEFLL